MLIQAFMRPETSSGRGQMKLHLLAIATSSRAYEGSESRARRSLRNGVDDLALQANQSGLVGRVEVGRLLERGDEPLGAPGAGLSPSMANEERVSLV